MINKNSVLFAAVAILTIAGTASCKRDELSSRHPKGAITFNVKGTSGLVTKSELDSVRVMKCENPKFESPLYLTITDELYDTYNPSVKGEVATSATLGKLYGEFAVRAYITSTQKPLVIDGKAKYQDGTWLLVDKDGNPVYYPEKKTNVTFWAYAPCLDSEKMNHYVDFDESAEDFISFNYESDDSDGCASADLVFAYKVQNSGEVSLAFEHALAAINIVPGDLPEGYTMKYARFEGLLRSGWCYYLPTEEKHFDWDYFDDDFCSYSADFGDGAGEMNKDRFHFIMPQTMPFDAMLYVGFEDEEGEVVESSFEIGDYGWAVCDYGFELYAGHKYTFRVGYNPAQSYTFELSDEELEPFNAFGETKDYQITSYKTHLDETTESVSFTRKYSTDGKTWVTTSPSGLTIKNKNWENYTSTYDATLAAITYTSKKNNPVTTALKAAAPVSGIYDLSTKGGTTKRNTANCYIVSAPGTYSFPAVYGCGIKNGKDNPASYADQCFVDATGYHITTPYIEQYEHIGDPVLIWQDVDGLVTNLRAEGSRNETIIFDVPKAKIEQGNAVIGITEDATGQILWSWHIWVTTQPTGQERKTIENADGETYTIMGKMLGQCDESITVNPRDFYIKYTQNESGKELVLHIHQDGAEFFNANACYYNMGRKDPCIGQRYVGAAHSAINKTCYPTNAVQIITSQLGNVAAGILSPGVMVNTADPNWCNGLSDKMWGKGNGSEFKTKTIYDPCPYGYIVPDSGAFSGITYNGNGWSNQHFADKYGSGVYASLNSPYVDYEQLRRNGYWTTYCKKMPNLDERDDSWGTYTIPYVCERGSKELVFWDSYGQIFTLSVENKGIIRLEYETSLAPIFPIEDKKAEGQDSVPELIDVDIRDYVDEGNTEIQF